MESGDIGHWGELHTEAWLKARGYACYRNTQLPGATDIEARGTTKSLLVQVKTGLSPSVAPQLSSKEQRNITSRANRLGNEAWLAQVQINRSGAQVGEIGWSKLN
ncbi:MAG: hypothetical protein HGA87_05045 [Desulfobulbaceae bacterium]|nr:hypothetical protein [Desulfobulbaceae bacterium]